MASYVYDGLGRRVAATDQYGLHASVYDSRGQLLYTTTQVNGTAQAMRLVYLAGKLIAEQGSAGTSYVSTDALGSPVARTDAGAQVQSVTRYEPYGGVAAGANLADVGFTGHLNEPLTGLVYMQQRYYDLVAGRFLSVDPVVTDADFGTAFNRYAYVDNNPYRYTDPDGRETATIELPKVTVTAPKVPSPSLGSRVLAGTAARAAGIVILATAPGNAGQVVRDQVTGPHAGPTTGADSENASSADGAKDTPKGKRRMYLTVASLATSKRVSAARESTALTVSRFVITTNRIKATKHHMFMNGRTGSESTQVATIHLGQGEGAEMCNWESLVEATIDAIHIDGAKKEIRIAVTCVWGEGRQKQILATGVEDLVINEMRFSNIVDRVSHFGAHELEDEGTNLAQRLFFLMRGRAPSPSDLNWPALMQMLTRIQNGSLSLLEVAPVYGATILILAKDFGLEAI